MKRMITNKLSAAALVAVAALFAASFAGCDCGGKENVELTLIQVTPVDEEITMEQTQQYQATGIYSDGTNEDLSDLVTWASEDEGVATIDENGLASPVAGGETTISATYQGITGNATLTVIEKELERIEVTPATATLAIGTTQQLQVTGFYTDGTNEDLTADADWASSDDAVATVTAGGLVEGVTEGTATITATVGTLDDTAAITVLGVGVRCETLTISTVSGDTTVPVGMTLEFAANCAFSDGENRDVTNQATWASSDTGVATISNDAGSQGELLGEDAGMTDVTASYENADGTTTDSNAVTITVTDAEVEEIQVTPVSELSHGEDVQYTATCVLTDSSTYDCTADVTWDSSDTDVATISNATGEEGLATPNADGTTTISAQRGTVTSNDAILVVVMEATCDSIDVTPAAPTPLPIGETQQFEAMCTYSDGTTGSVTADVTWASSAETVATISNASGDEGLATGVALGTTQITAALGTVVSPAVTLTVTDATPVSILVEPASLAIPVGSTDDFTATVTYSDSTTRNVTTDAGCTWTSSAPAVATVLQGTVTAVTVGSASITATFAGLSDSKPVTVIPGTLDRIDVTPANGTTPIGTDLQFTAMGHYTDGSYLNITTSVTWTSSNTGIATISNAMGTEGLAHGVAAGGPITITAARSGITGTAQLTISGVTVTAIDVTPALPDYLPIGLTQQFTATCTYSDSTVLPCTTDASLTWASSVTTVARISNDAADKGLAVGVAVGTANITAAIGAVTSPPVALRVTDAVLTSIEVTPDPASVPAGFYLGFTAMGRYSDDHTADLTTSVTWTSSNTGVATVSNVSGTQGIAYGVAPGTSTITATEPISGVAGTRGLEVRNVFLSSIQVTPATATINEGETYQFTATGFFSDGTTLDITESSSWYAYICPILCSGGAGSSVSNTAGTRGLFTAGAYGVVAVYAGAGGLLSADVHVTIRSTTLDHVVVTLPRNNVPIGHTFQAQCEAYYADGSHNDVTTSATWSSSVTTVATVSNAPGSQGLISTAGAGTTSITCDYSGRNASSPLTVQTCTLNSIDVVPNDPTASIGTTVQFTARGTYGSPCDPAWFDLTQMVTWNSSNTAIATISNAPGSKGLATVGASSGFSDIEGRLGTVYEVSRLTATGACIDSVYLVPATPTIPVGADIDLDAYGCRSDDTACASPVELLDSNLNWTRPTPAGHATVSGTGLVTGVAAGPETIQATLTSGACTTGENATTVVTVSDATLESITVQPASQTIGRGQQLQYTALGNYSDGSTHDITTYVVWTSTVTSVATIGANGLATASLTNEGTTQITAARAGVTGYTSLSVSAAVLQSLAVSVTPAQPAQGFPVGIYVQFECTGTYSDTSTRNVTASATFSSSSDTVLAVDNAAATKGRGTTQAVGSANVTCNIGTTNSPNFPVTVNNATLQTITVAPANPTINKGTQQQFTATGNYSNGTSFTITRRVTWNSSNTAIAALSNTEPTQGLATASTTNEGTVTVTAIYGGVTGTTQLTVSGACIDHVEVTPVTTTVIAGRDVNFTATAVYSDASSANITTAGGTSWSSSATGVATVAGGVAHGVAAGTATITASTSTNTCSGTESDDATLEVSNAVLTGITVSCNSTTPPPGLQTQCRAYGTYSDGTSGTDITADVGWSSTNTAVATVSDASPTKGLVNAVAAGNATITATQGTIQGTQTLNVPSCALSTIDVTPNNQNVPATFTVQYAATGTWTAACGAHDISAYVAWDSSNPAAATISATGLATTVAAGTTNITATYLTIVGTEPLTVNTAVLNTIDVEAGTCTANLPDGGSCKMEARGYFTDGHNRLVTEEATWSSNNEAVATAGNAPGDRGRINAVDPGSAVITAVVGTHSDTRPITVTSACLQSISITPANPSYPVDIYAVFTATGIYSDTSTQNLTSTAAWNSSNTAVIAVPSSTGEALTNGTGTATVSAQVGGGCTGTVTGNTTVNVTGATLNTIDVAPANPNVPNGLDQQMTAWGNYSDGGRYDITRRVTWASANTAVATISNAPGSRGLASAEGMGTTLISATKGLVSGSTDFEVIDAVLTGIRVTTDAPYVGYTDGNTVRYPENGLQLQFHAIGSYSAGPEREITDSVGWTSNNEAAATVSAGLVTTGTVTADTTVRITAASGSISGFLDIVVMNGAPTAIAIAGGIVSIANGTSTQWECVATMGAYQYYVSRSTAWSSDSEAIATVSNAAGEWGRVTGHSIGSTTIWARWSTLSTNRNIAVTAAVLSYLEVVPPSLTVVADYTYYTPFYLNLIGHFTDTTTQDLTGASGMWWVYDEDLLWSYWIWGFMPDYFELYGYRSYYEANGWCNTTTYVTGCYGSMCSSASGHDAAVFISCP